MEPGPLPPPPIDHLILGVPDLEAAMDDVERRFGVRPLPGGSHPGRGTRNALLGLGEGVYLELLGPDPAQPAVGERLFGVEQLQAPRLVGWCARADRLEARVARARASGYDPGDPRPGSRQRPDGSVLRWTYTAAPPPAGDGVVPFLIDWGASPHPSVGLPQLGRLVAVRGGHPAPETVIPVLAALGIALPVDRGSSAGLAAAVLTPRGLVLLR